MATHHPLNFEKLQHGCKHHRRRCKIRAPCCNRVFGCRHCHNDAIDSLTNTIECDILPRHDVNKVICSICATEQEVAQDCVTCGVRMGEYFCDVCKVHDDDTTKKPFHCDDCGICRHGGRENYFHCQTCGACCEVSLLNNHVCIENSMKSDCPICFEYLFESLDQSVILKCGHTIHLKCYTEMREIKQYRCPRCFKTMFNMSSEWEKLEDEIRSSRLPAELRRRAKIICNDCCGESVLQYHPAGSKCKICDSYNTREIRQ